MKKAILTLFALLFIYVLHAQEKNKNSETISIKTSAICEKCKQNIEKALSYEKGINKSTLDLTTKNVIVTYNPKKTNPEKIKKAINKAGYDADESPADPKAYENLSACCKKDYKH
jgi:copper chaperone CopZ